VRGVPAALAVILAAALAACSQSPTPTPSAEESSAPTVTAELRDITSVVVVSGDVLANPHFLVNAPAEGSLAYSSRSGSIDAGTTIATVGGTAVVTPALGPITQWLRLPSERVAKNSPIAEMSYAGFGIAVSIPAQQLYRIYDATAATGKANITGGPSGISCTLVATATATAAETEAPASPDTGYRPSICLLPIDADVVAGLPSKVGIPTGAKSQVLSLPVTAVSGSASQGEVTVIEGKKSTRVAVELGISDGAFVEIVSGLKAGDQVLARAPGVV